MLKDQLVNLLNGMVNLSVSGDVEDVIVLSNIDVIEEKNSISITGTGLNEYEEEVINDSFFIDMNTVKAVQTSYGDIEVHTTDGLVLIESF